MSIGVSTPDLRQAVLRCDHLAVRTGRQVAEAQLVVWQRRVPRELIGQNAPEPTEPGLDVRTRMVRHERHQRFVGTLGAEPPCAVDRVEPVTAIAGE